MKWPLTYDHDEIQVPASAPGLAPGGSPASAPGLAPGGSPASAPGRGPASEAPPPCCPALRQLDEN